MLNRVETYLDTYDKVRHRTIKVIELITPPLFNYRITENAFSIGELGAHIALIERDLYQPSLVNKPPAYDGNFEPYQNSEQLVKLFDATSKHMHQLFEEKDDVWMNEKCSYPGGQITRWKWLRLQLEHEIHHRGQMYMLLSANGIKVPNIFGLSAEDVSKLR